VREFGMGDTQTNNLLKQIAAIIPIGGIFLYFVSRQFTQSYYGYLGIPSSALSFSTVDYIYRAMMNGLFVVAFILTFIAYSLWAQLNIHGYLEPIIYPSKKSNRFYSILNDFRASYYLKGFPWWFWIIYYFLFVILYFVYSFAPVPASPNPIILKTVLNLFITMPVLYWAFVIVIDPQLMLRIRNHRILRRTFSVSLIFTLIFSLITLPGLLGTLFAFNSSLSYSAHFPTVSVILNQGNIFENSSISGAITQVDEIMGAQLLLKTNDGIFIKIQAIDSAVFIPNEQIDSILSNKEK
jgi:hypothetical protein